MGYRTDGLIKAIKSREDLGSPYLKGEANGLVWVNFYLALGANPNSRDKDGKTALILAIESASLDIVDSILAGSLYYQASNTQGKEDKCDVNLPDNQKNTPLICATKKGNLAMIDALFAQGKKNGNPVIVDKPNSEGKTPIFYAASNNSKPVLEKLLENGCNPNLPHDLPPLAYFIENNQPDQASCLLENVGDQLNVDYASKTQESLLVISLKKGFDRVARGLLNHKIPDNINDLKGKQGNSLLAWALQHKYYDVATKLVKKFGIKLNEAGEYASLMQTFISTEDIYLVSELMSAPNLSKEDFEEGKQFLEKQLDYQASHPSRLGRTIEDFLPLINNGHIDLNNIQDTQKNPLLLAFLKGEEPTIFFNQNLSPRKNWITALIKAGADPSLANPEGETIFTVAVAWLANNTQDKQPQIDPRYYKEYADWVLEWADETVLNNLPNDPNIRVPLMRNLIALCKEENRLTPYTKILYKLLNNSSPEIISRLGPEIQALMPTSTSAEESHKKLPPTQDPDKAQYELNEIKPNDPSKTETETEIEIETTQMKTNNAASSSTGHMVINSSFAVTHNASVDSAPGTEMKGLKEMTGRKK